MKTYKMLIALMLSVIVSINGTTYVEAKTTYKTLKVKGGDTSGKRKANVKVDIGYGSRVYWSYTNKYGQVTKVTAKKIVKQNPKTEKLTSQGRYYANEAKVRGTELKDMDQGHIIADDLGGVANAYNITPQHYTVNRGEMKKIENLIKKQGAKNLTVTINYPDKKTLTPSSYTYTFTSKGKKHKYVLKNKKSKDTTKTTTTTSTTKTTNTSTTTKDVSVSEWLKKLDTNNNGKITITEAKAGKVTMPVKKSDTPNLYSLMSDTDKDGLVGE